MPPARQGVTRPSGVSDDEVLRSSEVTDSVEEDYRASGTVAMSAIRPGGETADAPPEEPPPQEAAAEPAPAEGPPRRTAPLPADTAPPRRSAAAASRSASSWSSPSSP